MQDLRPPSYRAIVESDGLFTTVSSSRWPYSTDDLVYDPPSGFFAGDMETTEILSKARRQVTPRRNQNPSKRLGGPFLPLAPGRAFPVEKRLPGPARPRTGENICYAFSQTGFNSMSLIPTTVVGEDQPQYHITIHMNCFMPLSHITKVHRFLHTRAQEKVGEFEMGITTVPGKVQVGPHGGLISSILSKSGSRSSGSWFWNPLLGINTKYGLKWDYYDKRPCVCSSTDYGNKTVLALFTSPFGLDSNSEVAMLEVTPAGQELFDHVLMSLLVIERKRLTPDKENALKPLFS